MRPILSSYRCRVLGTVATALLVAGAARATPVVVNDPYQWLENRSTNTLGRVPGLRQNIGVNSAVPNGLSGTTATATQGSTVLPLPYSGSSAIANEFNFTLPANPALFGPWQLSFTNGADTTTVNTPSIAPGLAPMPFVRDVRLTNQSATSFAWSIPPSASLDAVRVNLFDRGRLNLAGTGADIVYNATFAASTTSFTLPSTLVNGLPLIQGNLYTLEINLLDFVGNVPGAQNDLRNRSRLYVDFLPGPTPASGAFLPVVEPGVNGAAPLFHFDISRVGSQQIFIDPLVAKGYTYKIGVGNPNFASVLLPTGIGDGLYTIVLDDGSTFGATGGTSFAFAAGGVGKFTVLGIEESAGLNAADPTAFLTGLTFASAGSFTGTMQAVVAIPEPSTWLMLFTGLLLLAAHRRAQGAAPAALASAPHNALADLSTVGVPCGEHARARPFAGTPAVVSHRKQCPRKDIHDGHSAL
jgi:hypothetical protein